MIELLGVGVRDAQNAWLLRKVCARLDRGTLAAIVSSSAVQSAALLDAVTGRRIPDEGRVWVTRVPLMRETTRRVRALVADPTAAAFVSHRSVLWNTLVTRGTVLAGLVRFPRRPERQAALSALEAVGLGRRTREPLVALAPGDRLRVAVARMLCRRPAALVLRDVDAALGCDEAGPLLGVMRRLVRSHRLTGIVSVESAEVARRHADRVLILAHGALASDILARDIDAPAAAPGLQRVRQ